jgi:hypothetical protein
MQQPNVDEQVTLLFDREIKVSFDLGAYRLIPGYVGELGLPLEAFLHLYVVVDSYIVTEITGLEDLSKMVTAIHNEAEALAFVQLLTAQQSHYFFNKEITVIDLVVVSGIETPGVGAISQVRAQQLGIPAPQVTQDNQGFRIERNLIKSTSLSGPREIVRRTERVSTSGKYTLVSESPLIRLDAAEVQIPYYE